MNNSSLLNPRALLFGVVGLVLGLLVGYFLFGLQGIGVGLPPGDPWTLTSDAKEQWVAMTADSFSLNGDRNLASQRLRGYDSKDISAILSKLVTDRQSSNRPLDAQRLQNFATTFGITLTAQPTTGGTPKPGATPVSTNPTGGAGNSNLTQIALIAGGVLLVAIVAALGFILIRRRQAATVSATDSGASVATLRMAEMTRTPAASATSAPSAMKPAPSTSAPPSTKPILGIFAATYKFGDDNYDTSFSLETLRGEFLGETGMGASEVVGDGKPDKITAFDLWLFDKGDVRTVTKILMSEFAYNDQTLRAKLASKGELVQAEKGKRVVLETATLRVEAEIVDLVYASTPGLPANSHFQKLIVEMVPAQK